MTSQRRTRTQERDRDREREPLPWIYLGALQRAEQPYQKCRWNGSVSCHLSHMHMHQGTQERFPFVCLSSLLKSKNRCIAPWLASCCFAGAGGFRPWCGGGRGELTAMSPFVASIARIQERTMAACLPSMPRGRCRSSTVHLSACVHCPFRSSLLEN